MQLTEDLLRDLLRDAASRAPRIPTEQLLAGMPTGPVRGHRRSWWAGAGALSTAAAVAVVLVVSAAQSDRSSMPAQTPASASAPRPVGPDVTAIGNVSRTAFHVGQDWMSIAYGNSENAWAAGTNCTSEKPDSCHVILARSNDGGSNWISVRPPKVPILVQGSPVALVASGSRVWLADFTSADAGRTWTKLTQFAPNVGTSDPFLFSPSAYQGRMPYYVTASPCPSAIGVFTVPGASGSRLATIPASGGRPDFGDVASDGTIWIQTAGQPDGSGTCKAVAPARTYQVSVRGKVTSVPSGAWSLDVALDASTAFYDRPGDGGSALGVTHDGGRTITPVSTGAFPDVDSTTGSGFFSVEAAFDSTNLLFGQERDGGSLVYASHDGGRTHHLVLSLGNENSGRITVLSRTSAAVAGIDGTVYRTDDAGNTWHPIGTLPAAG